MSCIFLKVEAILAFLLMSCSQGSGLSSTLSSLGESSLSEGETAVVSVPAIDYSPERSTIGIPGADLVTSSLSYYLGYDEVNKGVPGLVCYPEESPLEIELLSVGKEKTYLGLYFPSSQRAELEAFIASSDLDQSNNTFAALDDFAYLDGKYYYAAAELGLLDTWKAIERPSVEDFSATMDGAALGLVLERKEALFLGDPRTGEVSRRTSSVLARQGARVEKGNVYLDDHPPLGKDARLFHDIYEAERASIDGLSSGYRIVKKGLAAQAAIVLPSGNPAWPLDGGFESIKILEVDGEAAIAERRYEVSGEEKTDLLFEESPSSYAEDPYGPLRPLFQKALIEGSSPQNDLYSYYRAADVFPGLSALMGEE